MNTANLIDTLAQDAAPAKPVRARNGQLAAIASAIATLGLVLGYFGIRPQLMQGTMDAVSLLICALFAMLAITAGITATRMAQPAVGGSQGGGLWIFAALLLFPLIAAVEHVVGHPASSEPHVGMECLTLGGISSLLTAAVLTLHLRRGAPVMPERAGLLAGLSAGGVGALAVTLECSASSFSHLAFWHVAVVVLWAILGRFGIARLIRW